MSDEPEALRALLHRHADELAECLSRLANQTPAAKKEKARRARLPRAIMAPAELPVDDVTKARVDAHLRRLGI